MGEGVEASWLYLWDTPPQNEKAFSEYLKGKASTKDPLYYAVINKSTGLAVGFKSLKRIEPQHRTIEIGGIVYGKSLQRTPAATEA